MKNPNGYGSVVKLSGNRRKPFMVRKTTGFNDKGYPIYKIIGYCKTREDGNILLAQYNNDPWNVDTRSITLKDLYAKMMDTKANKFSDSLYFRLKMAYNYICQLENTEYRFIKAVDMQKTIDDCHKSYSTKQAIKTLWHHLDKIAIAMDVCNKNYSNLLEAPAAQETKRKPFTHDEIVAIQNNLDDPICQITLILLYTGMRINELLKLNKSGVDPNEMIITCGLKSRAGKNRKIPIHAVIQPIIKSFYDQTDTDKLINITYDRFNKDWRKTMTKYGMKHVTHETRHTFETVLDNAGGNRKCIDMLMGHASKDVGNRVYNHKTIDQLRETINLIKY